MKLIKLGAIDIGSNSVRCLITNVIKDKKGVHFQKSSITRLPIRLGADSFLKGEISKKNAKRLIEGMKAYKHIMSVHGVKHFRACATSAMRDASNGAQLVDQIFEKTGIPIEIIKGKEEAQLIFDSEVWIKFEIEETTYCYIDVGGGSTELTLFDEGKIIASKSFNLGTVRILNNLDAKDSWEEFSSWIKKKTKGYSQLVFIGSGGNINKIFKMSGKRPGMPLDREHLETTWDYLDKFSIRERMIRLGLNPDRADVIIPALRIYLTAMRSGGAQKMYVPKIGVSDGITRDLYRRIFDPEEIK